MKPYASLPKSLVAAALAKHAVIGRHYDSQGQHVCYFYKPRNGPPVYRQTVVGMLSLLRLI